MGCASSRPQEGNADPHQANGATAGAQAAAPAKHRSRLNQPLADKARHPSAIPGSFLEREHRFRQARPPAHPLPPRREGPCRVRTSGWSGWQDGWAQLGAHDLLVFPAASAAAPGSGSSSSATGPHCQAGAEALHRVPLVGAHLRRERQKEVVLAPASGQALTLLLPDEQQCSEWMLGLATVPGLFRRVQDYYALGPSWGYGATCQVCECTNTFSGATLALKTRLHKSREATLAMHNELRILQICAKHPHPAIPVLHDYFFDQDGSVELVLDLMEGGELFDHIAMSEQLKERDARRIFQQVADGVAHLHSLGIAHRDLKPQNLMYVSADEGSQVKIMDYDLAKMSCAPTWEAHTPCGTLHYMAPEIVLHQRYSLAVDMWSAGVILYILLTGHVPFDGKDSDSIAAAVEAGQYCMEGKLWGGVSDEAKDLVRRLLQRDPEQRLTAQQVLQHPWLTSKLDASLDADLASPAELRNTLSKTERGRKLLAVAGLTYSEGDLRAPRSAAGPARQLSRLIRQQQPVGQQPAPAPLDFDMQPVRDQAGDGDHDRTSGGAAVQDSAAVARLRSQLELVGAAAGLQDQHALLASGQAVAPSSPRQPAAWPMAHGPVPVADQQQQQQQLLQQLGGGPFAACGDGFEGLGAVVVEEQDISSRGGTPTPPQALSRRTSREAGGLSPRRSFAMLAATAQQQQAWPPPHWQSTEVEGGSPVAPPVAPLHLEVPAQQQQLPTDEQLLEQLSQAQQRLAEQWASGSSGGHGASAAPAGSSAAAAAQGGKGSMKRAKSARHAGPNSGYSSGDSSAGACSDDGGLLSSGLMRRSASTSVLKQKGQRLKLREREPVDRAMHQKLARLSSLASALH